MDIHTLMCLLVFSVGFSDAYNLTSSSERGIVGVDFTFTCTTKERILTFRRDYTNEATIIGGYPNGTCDYSGSHNNNYTFDCNKSTGVYSLTIPSSFHIEALHGSTWTCYSLFTSSSSSPIHLYVYVPITQVTITTIPTNNDQTGIILDRDQIFTCKTNAGRPSSRIQWYISDTNITGSATPQADVCNTNCNGKVISSSKLKYTGIKSDDGKIIYCTAVNVKGYSVRSENKTIVIWYGPHSVRISPQTTTYTVNESTGSIGPVTCKAEGCKPECIIKWTGPNLTGGHSSILFLQNIDKSKTGNYFCTASNEAWNMTSVNISIIVNYRPTKVNISPLNQMYTVQEIAGSIGPIYCTADCEPECIMTWHGPNIPDGTTSVLNLTSINRNQAGDYQCEATNIIGSEMSVIVKIMVNYGPGQVNIIPKKLMYTVTETTGEVGPINCTADCNPSCSMTWTGPNIRNGAVSVLYLQEIDRTQAGNYHCIVSNNYGNKSSSTVSVIVNYGPMVVTISPLKENYTTIETIENVGPINCTADCKPGCTMTWTGPNLPEGITSVLYLQNISKMQAGYYSCNASNIVSSLKSVGVNVMVNYAPGEVNITPMKLMYTVTETTGEVGPIKCTADCNPNCSKTWTGPNFHGGTLSVLYLPEIDRNQTGNYMCTASNNYGNKTSSIVTVIVNYGPRLVTISPLKENYTAIETIENVGPISCTADCKPGCTLTWTGPNLSEGITSVLFLQNISKIQAGYYSCNASNSVSVKSVRVHVVVNYGPDFVIISPNKNQYIVNETNNILPIFCTSDCNPNCSMTWSGPHPSVEDSSVLNLHSIDRSQTGIYICTASNFVGSKISLEVNVVVNFRPSIDLFGNRTYTENNTVSLSCEIQSVPTAAITWSFANRIIDSSVLYFVNNNSKVSTLTIRRVGCLSMGSYTCLAKNVIGEDKKAIDIDITCSPRINDFEYNISTSIAVKDQSSLNVTVPIIAYPKPNIYWTHISSGTILNVTQKTSNVFLTNRIFSTLHIANITTVDYGLYRIYAVNDIGKTDNLIHSYEVIPKQEPIPPCFVYIVCKSTTGTIIWKPGVNGDSSDRFYVMYSERGHKVITKHLDHNEREETSVYTITDLKAAIEYDFYIVAENQFGKSRSRTVICITDAACPLENVGELKSNENTTMLGAGIGTLVVALLVLAAATIFVIRNKLRNKNTKPGISDEYTDIQRSNPTFIDDYSTLQSGIESRPFHEHSTYEECGQTFDASAYQNINKMKSGQDKTQKKQAIYDNMKI